MTAPSTTGLRRTASRSGAARAFAVDLALVLAFVLIGRASHDEAPLLGALRTLWPFAAGLVVGWGVCRGWRAPLDLVRTGLPVVVATVTVGMVLRALTGQGVAVSFVIVATVFLALFLLGWRAMAAAARRRRTREAG